MVLLSSMNALILKQINGVRYTAESYIPDTNGLEGITVHHESLSLMKMYNTVQQVGGSTIGELILHTNGDSLDMNTFEDTKDNDMEEKNV